MAHDSGKPGKRRLHRPESPPNDDEEWKTSSSTETTSDEGRNAELAEEHERDENVGPPRKADDARKPGR